MYTVYFIYKQGWTCTLPASDFVGLDSILMQCLFLFTLLTLETNTKLLYSTLHLNNVIIS